MRYELRARLATLRMIGESLIKAFDVSIVFAGHAMTSVTSDVFQNLRRVRVGERGNDNTGHQPFRAASRAAVRALCSSRDMNSPRSSAASPSSTRGFAQAKSSSSSSRSAMRSSISCRAASSIEAKAPDATWDCSHASCSGVRGINMSVCTNSSWHREKNAPWCSATDSCKRKAQSNQSSAPKQVHGQSCAMPAALHACIGAA
jgi:hypothetical protein